MKNITLYGAALLSLLIVGCSQSTPDTREADTKALKDLETQWNQDYASKDADKLLARYADNAVLMAPGMPASSGKDAIKAELNQMLSDPALSLKFESSKVAVARSGDLAYTQGSYTTTMTNPATKKVVNDHGSYVTDYLKQPDGTWKAVADIVTSDVPPAMPSAPRAMKKRAAGSARTRKRSR